MSDSREQFDKWLASAITPPESITEYAWMAWQASRAQPGRKLTDAAKIYSHQEVADVLMEEIFGERGKRRFLNGDFLELQPSVIVDIANLFASLAAQPAAATVPEWISVKDRLPEERAKPYQVIVACTKKYGGVYEGRPVRRFIQDWVVRNWPQNFTHWMEAMDWPPAAQAQDDGEKR